MLTLPGQYEFLSEDFMAEGRAFLERETAALRARDAARPFTLSERFTDAPPHLKFPGDLATWQIAFDGANLSVERGFNPDADVTIEGDYQAAVMAQQFVGAASPTDSAVAGREVQQVFGKDCIRIKGRFDSEALNETQFGFIIPPSVFQKDPSGNPSPDLPAHHAEGGK